MKKVVAAVFFSAYVLAVFAIAVHFVDPRICDAVYCEPLHAYSHRFDIRLQKVFTVCNVALSANFKATLSNSFVATLANEEIVFTATRQLNDLLKVY